MKKENYEIYLKNNEIAIETLHTGLIRIELSYTIHYFMFFFSNGPSGAYNNNFKKIVKCFQIAISYCAIFIIKIIKFLYHYTSLSQYTKSTNAIK